MKLIYLIKVALAAATLVATFVRGNGKRKLAVFGDPNCGYCKRIERNLELGRKYKISGTPTLIFTNGRKVPGAIGTAQIEMHLTEAKN